MEGGGGGGGMEVREYYHDDESAAQKVEVEVEVAVEVEEEEEEENLQMMMITRNGDLKGRPPRKGTTALTTAAANGGGGENPSPSLLRLPVHQVLVPEEDQEEEKEEEKVVEAEQQPNNRSTNKILVDDEEVITVHHHHHHHNNNDSSNKGEEEESQISSSSSSSSEKSVYLDRAQGTWKCRHCIWTHRMESSGIDHIQNPKGHCHGPMNIITLTQQEPYFGLDIKDTESNNGTDGIRFLAADRSTAEKAAGKDELDFKVKNPDAGKSLADGINHHENLKDARQTGLHFLLSENLLENGNANVKPVDKNVHFGAVKESKQEVAEWDVERVLEEQDTHDLYCPNCKSCITKRVILRKRKRKVPNIGSGNKREKTETPVQSSLDADPSVGATYSQGHTTVESSSDVSPDALGTNDGEHDTGPDMFRCLSCFSFFIPTVAGFKLFRIFGVKNEGESIQNPQQTPTTSTRTSERGDDAMHAEEGDVQALNRKQSLSNQRSDHVSSMLGVSLPNRSLLQSEQHENEVESKMGEKDFVVSTNQGTLLLEEAKIGDEETQDGAKTKSADEKNGSISSLVSTFPFLEQSHVNEQGKGAMGKHKVDEQNVLVSSMQGAALLLETQIHTEDEHECAGKKIDGVSGLPGYYYTLEDENVRKQKSWKDDKDILTSSEKEALLLQDRRDEIGKPEGVPTKSSAGDDVILIIREEPVGAGASRSVQNDIVPAAPVIPPVSESELYAGEQGVVQARRSGEWDILKSIVYGGLIEAITSLGVVSSAAGADVTTLNILALGLANLVSGLLIIVHGLWELKNEQHGKITDVEEEKVDRYEQVLGQRNNFRRHAIVAVLSYIIFGLLPPITYGFSFHKSSNKEYKLIAVAAVSLVCIILLAIGKAHTRKPPNKSYIKTTLYFVSIGIMASGLSYVSGELIKKLLEKLALFEPNAAAVTFPPSSSAFLLETKTSSKPTAWASY